eukprot:CAMPEP_0179900972 /NCGR_PEP_ID=MMETSP0982-20121206/39454_1 /TAXON_ID=483367 /ORGANISM="non described non described, Strain CCMP 2436" /LENGTH=196 /DNA_ID=CAMNT_0021799365 /DNA_START=104 /DNA_END=694 /DNA_ORIENTATION=-
MSSGSLGGGGSGMGEGLGSTLDEPVMDTIMRDVRMVGTKMKCVMDPRRVDVETLKDWDLWGPLLLCLILATILSASAPADQKSLVFTSVFVIVWCGSGVVTVNALLLGGTLSFFQCICVLGYCIFPLTVASIFCVTIGAMTGFWIRLLVVAFCFVWATSASVGFLSTLVPENRRALAAYPVFLFYLSLSWMVALAS